MSGRAHPRKPLVSETRGLRGWAATLPRAPALGFLEGWQWGFVMLALGFFGRLAVGFCNAGTGLFAVCGFRFEVCGFRFAVWGCRFWVLGCRFGV